MSIVEKSFLKWFGSIAAALIISSIVSLVSMSRAVAVAENNVNTNKKDIIELREYHREDVQLIRTDIQSIKSDQSEIKRDIKEILKEIK